MIAGNLNFEYLQGIDEEGEEYEEEEGEERPRVRYLIVIDQ